MTNFIAFDGEGYTRENDGVHIFNLLGSSEKEYVYNNAGLKTLECFEYMLMIANNNPECTFVSFYFSYDVNMMLGNVPRESIDRLKTQGFTILYLPNNPLKSYRIEYIARKFFTLIECTRPTMDSPWKRTTKVKIWDVFGFFQSSFVKALKEFNVGTKDQIKLLMDMKSSRADFTTESLDDIIKYNKLECILLVELMNNLNDSLVKAGIEISSWHGAGAVAQQLMKNHNVERYIKAPMDNFIYPVRCAYFGGRIQAIQIGHIKETVHTHDLVSAYPNAIQRLPSLYKARQKRVKKYDPTLPYTIWHVSWDLPDNTVITPFPFRLKDGRIDYPLKGEGYYWDCEVRVAMKYFAQYITVHKGYQFVITDQVLPFDFVPDLFEKRKEYKKAGNHAQYAIKLALNSLYGKTAQSTGNAKYQCYIWAGLITADTRSRMLDLAMLHKDDVIAFATDGLLSTSQHCEDGDKTLGSWEVDKYHSLFIIKPGFYTARVIGGKTIRKVRGFMPKEVKFTTLKREWRVWDICGNLQLPSNRFVGMKATSDYRRWRTWERGTRELTMRPSVGTPEMIENISTTIYRIIPDKYDECSKAYNGVMFDEMDNTQNHVEQEIWG